MMMTIIITIIIIIDNITHKLHRTTVQNENIGKEFEYQTCKDQKYSLHVQKYSHITK